MHPHPPKHALWKQALGQRTVWLRACKLGLTAGAVQAFVNQGDVWLHHAQTLETVAKTVLSPVISFALVLLAGAETWVQKNSEQQYNK